MECYCRKTLGTIPQKGDIQQRWLDRANVGVRCILAPKKREINSPAHRRYGAGFQILRQPVSRIHQVATAPSAATASSSNSPAW